MGRLFDEKKYPRTGIFEALRLITHLKFKKNVSIYTFLKSAQNSASIDNSYEMFCCQNLEALRINEDDLQKSRKKSVSFVDLYNTMVTLFSQFERAVTL